MSAWWSEVAEAGQWLSLFDSLPGVFFYAKDLEHRFRRVNRAMAELHGCVSPGDMVGRGDMDFHPPALAAQYVEEDLVVIRSGEALLDRNWLVPGADGLPRWFLSSKFPIRCNAGHVVGIAGVMRPHEGIGDAGKSSYARLTPALKHVLGHFGEPVTMEDLASLCHFSVSQLQRDFQRCFGCTPSSYLLGVRLLMARSRLVQTSDPIGVIALECGFYDQSHFTRAFQRANGLSPLSFRRSAQQGQNRGRI